MEEKSPSHGYFDAPCVLRNVYQLVIDCFMYFLSPFIISRMTHSPFLPVSMAPSALVEASILPTPSSGPLRKPSRSGFCVKRSESRFILPLHYVLSFWGGHKPQHWHTCEGQLQRLLWSLCGHHSLFAPESIFPNKLLHEKVWFPVSTRENTQNCPLVCNTQSWISTHPGNWGSALVNLHFPIEPELPLNQKRSHSLTLWMV